MSCFVMFNDLRSEVIVIFVNISWIVDHHCLTFLVFIIVDLFLNSWWWFLIQCLSNETANSKHLFYFSIWDLIFWVLVTINHWFTSKWIWIHLTTDDEFLSRHASKTYDERFEDMNWVIKSRKSQDRQYNGQTKKRTKGQTMISKTSSRKVKILMSRNYI